MAKFSWRGAPWIEVSIKRVNGKMVTSLCRKKVESDDDGEEDDDEEGEESD